MTEGNYANLNGLKMYYEVHGDGRPLILLHGGFGVVGMFGQVLPALAKNQQVIAVELEGHGHTALLDRPLSFEQMADDIAALIGHLKLAQADVMGYSLGGGVALQTVIRHSNMVRKGVIVSAPCKSAGWYPEDHAGMRSVNGTVAKTWIGSPMYEGYAGVAPRPEDWPTLADKMGRFLGQDYDWSKQVEALKTPIMIVIGDSDAVRPAHAVEFFELLGGGKKGANWDGSGVPNSQLAILPGTTHYNSFFSPLLPPLVKQFLDAPMPDAK
jgi:pimeloyl-ACP methyl ester carboxylesterase